MQKAILFDMDGVIIDSEPIHYKATKAYLNELGIQVSDEEYQTFIGTTDKEIFTRLKNKYSLLETVDNLVRTYEKRYMEYIQALTDEKPISGVLDLLEAIKRIGYPIALASSASKENIQTVLKLFGIEDFFDAVVSGYEVEKPKPAPDIFIRAACLLKVNPCNCIVIEDSSNGVKAAKAAGMKCIAFKNPNTGVQDLSFANIIIDKFDDKCMEWIMDALPLTAEIV